MFPQVLFVRRLDLLGSFLHIWCRPLVSCHPFTLVATCLFLKNFVLFSFFSSSRICCQVCLQWPGVETSGRVRGTPGRRAVVTSRESQRRGRPRAAACVRLASDPGLQADGREPAPSGSARVGRPGSAGTPAIGHEATAALWELLLAGGALCGGEWWERQKRVPRGFSRGQLLGGDWWRGERVRSFPSPAPTLDPRPRSEPLRPRAWTGRARDAPGSECSQKAPG